MREYQTAILKLSGRARDDEDALTDVLNERERAGWHFAHTSPLGATRLLIVFWREA
jgi:hypothetical protein